MKEVFFGHVLIAAMIALLPCNAHAQDEEMSFSEDQVDEAASEEETTESEDEGPSDADLLEALGEDDIEGEAEGGLMLPGAEEGEDLAQRHAIWAVQQIYAKKSRRLDVQPSWGVSMNDPYIQHMALSLGANYYLTEVLAVGLSFNFYRWLDVETDLNFRLGRATHQAVPINEYFWGGQLNFTYVPMYGKFSMFKEWILHWDVWVVGGGGVIFTRPIPNIDPEYRSFDWEPKIAFNVGIGGRIFLNRFLAIYVELRDYIFPEKLEALSAPTDIALREDKSLWLEDGYKLTNNVMLHAGVTIFFPFTFEYELPK